VKLSSPLILILFVSLLLTGSARANSYIEGGVATGTMKNAGNFFSQSSVGSTGLGFIGSLSVYKPFTSERHFYHLEFGIQNRFTTATDTNTKKSLAMFTPNLALRLEFFRFYVGGGYAPLVFGSASGATSLHTIQSAHSDFIEGGVIWRVIPELQISAGAALEFGSPKGSGTSPTITEYGLRFRFPFNPKDNSKKSVQYDGFRYPFGVMKD
jgi:hypothetical protein